MLQVREIFVVGGHFRRLTTFFIFVFALSIDMKGMWSIFQQEKKENFFSLKSYYF
jgi:hypothetical protein